MDEYGENCPTVAYGSDEIRVYYRICPLCGRFVKADKQAQIFYNQMGLCDGPAPPNATCAKHGRVTMPTAYWTDARDLEGPDDPN
jgi:hypothetical protein